LSVFKILVDRWAENDNLICYMPDLDQRMFQ